MYSQRNLGKKLLVWSWPNPPTNSFVWLVVKIQHITVFWMKLSPRSLRSAGNGNGFLKVRIYASYWDIAHVFVIKISCIINYDDIIKQLSFQSTFEPIYVIQSALQWNNFVHYNNNTILRELCILQYIWRR